MAKYLSKAAKAVTIALACMQGATLLAQAESLPDPTRPPAAAETSPAAASGKSESGPELQSVLISPTRKRAIINGQSVQVGDKYGEARVVLIAENEVVLRNGSERQVLKLFPQIEKQTVSGLAKAKSKSGSK